MHPEFAPIAFIAAFSLLFPLPWHWRARNVATLCIIGWFFVMNIIFAVNAIIWANNVDIVAPVWCDISMCGILRNSFYDAHSLEATKLVIGANFALPATCLCICMHLEQVSSVRITRIHIQDRRRRQYFEAFMCIGLPIIFMVLRSLYFCV